MNPNGAISLFFDGIQGFGLSSDLKGMEVSAVPCVVKGLMYGSRQNDDPPAPGMQLFTLYDGATIDPITSELTGGTEVATFMYGYYKEGGFTDPGLVPVVQLKVPGMGFRFPASCQLAVGQNVEIGNITVSLQGLFS
tara:strand:- start:62 stop:472 length:411 start_codon:yes stop_codon:yes gene_type:complete